MLSDFKSINYKDDIYEVGKVLNYYEWKNKGVRERFLHFAVEKQIIESSKIAEITNIFDEMLKQKIHENWFIIEGRERNTNKNKR